MSGRGAGAAGRRRRPGRPALPLALAPPLALTLLLTGCGGTGAGGSDAGGTDRRPSGPDVGGALQTARPAYGAGALPALALVVRNEGPAPCALPSVAQGSVEIVSVRRDGATVVGRPGREDLYTGLTLVVADGVRAVAPGASLTVPLDAESTAAGAPSLPSSRRTATDAARTTTYVLDTPGRYRVAARLAPPPDARRPDAPSWCRLPSPTAAVEFEVQR